MGTWRKAVQGEVRKWQGPDQGGPKTCKSEGRGSDDLCGFGKIILAAMQVGERPVVVTDERQ